MPANVNDTVARNDRADRRTDAVNSEIDIIEGLSRRSRRPTNLRLLRKLIYRG